MALQVGDEMKGETTNEVRAKVPGGNHCDQDLLDALDEIDAMVVERDALVIERDEAIRGRTKWQGRIDAMRAAQTTCYEFAREHYPDHLRLLSLIHAICDAGFE